MGKINNLKEALKEIWCYIAHQWRHWEYRIRFVGSTGLSSNYCKKCKENRY